MRNSSSGCPVLYWLGFQYQRNLVRPPQESQVLNKYFHARIRWRISSPYQRLILVNAFIFGKHNVPCSKIELLFHAQRHCGTKYFSITTHWRVRDLIIIVVCRSGRIDDGDQNYRRTRLHRNKVKSRIIQYITDMLVWERCCTDIIPWQCHQRWI